MAMNTCPYCKFESAETPYCPKCGAWSAGYVPDKLPAPWMTKEGEWNLRAEVNDGEVTAIIAEGFGISVMVTAANIIVTPPWEVRALQTTHKDQFQLLLLQAHTQASSDHYRRLIEKLSVELDDLMERGTPEPEMESGLDMVGGLPGEAMKEME